MIKLPENFLISMANQIFFSLLVVTIFSASCPLATHTNEARVIDERKVYIVYMGAQPKNELAATSLHRRMVEEITGSTAPDSVIYDYKRSFNGFAVKLTEQETHRMSEMEGVVSVFPSEKKQLQTTRSWDFIGLSQDVARSTLETDIIIGVIDSGIWPESESFNDQGMGPPPSRWKGICKESIDFYCNNKIIGAKYYKIGGEIGSVDFASPRDVDGHGTHTASTAVGRVVTQAGFGDFFVGTARIAVPSARIAVYKVCWLNDHCEGADILAAFDDAIADGVDIISISLATKDPEPYYKSAIAIGAFHAMSKGVLTSAAAGNQGPYLYPTSSCAPWVLSVAATTTDRVFITPVLLGNNEIYEGTSINTYALNNTMYPLIYGGDAPNVAGGFNSSSSRDCLVNSLDMDAVKGKILFCDKFTNGTAPLMAGAVGVVMHQHNFLSTDTSFFPLPTTFVSEDDAADIIHYIKSTSNPAASILTSTQRYGNRTSTPHVPFYSSRGPNPITSDTLKPDLSAPGDIIIAAYSEAAAIREGDNRLTKFKAFSGTSMACPHATSAAAYVKSFHPSWSPAALKSALMTTALKISDKFTGAEFAYGAGNIDPIKALDPGLIYDATTNDYAAFLCDQKYSSSMLRSVIGEDMICADVKTVWDLNYPSFAFSTKSLKYIRGTFSRNVTNVGSPYSTYVVRVTAPHGLEIKVNPSILFFTALGETRAFTSTIEGRTNNKISSAELIWEDGIHEVRSPIIVFHDSLNRNEAVKLYVMSKFMMICFYLNTRLYF